MNKKVKKAVQMILFAVIICAFIFIGTKDFSQKTKVDNERFDQEYKNVSKDNVFVYANANEVLTKLKSGTGVIFMGYPANIWSGPYANLLNEVAKEMGVSEILYYDFKENRDNQNGTY
ncbi:MAG: hypothetical protein K2J20_00605, partial [Bacilli bacterium]|nr:hypothetical protein [Bacilli bacterium]